MDKAEKFSPVYWELHTTLDAFRKVVQMFSQVKTKFELMINDKKNEKIDWIYTYYEWSHPQGASPLSLFPKGPIYQAD